MTENDELTTRHDLVSIVVPVKNGEATIGPCLRSLLACRPPAGLEMEILVVDDGSTDGTAEVVRGFPEVQLIQQDNAGPSAARNVGIRRSRGQAVLFTDDDCEVDPSWVVELVNVLRTTDAAAAGGTQRIHEEDSDLARDVSLFLIALGFCGGYTKLGDAIREVDHNPSCNSAYRREALDAIGGFSEGLWPGEDVELDLRIGKAGGRIIFNPRARVYHRRRGSWSGFWRMMYRYGCWSGGYLTRHYGFFRPLSMAPFFFLALLALVAWSPVAGGAILLLLLAGIVYRFARAGVPLASFPKMLLLTVLGGAAWNLGYFRGLLIGRRPQPGLTPVHSRAT